MPELDGYATTQLIRRNEQHRGTPKSQNEPIVIIAMTANAMAGEREKCIAAGMNDYLAKPVKKEQLASILNVWLPRAAERPALPAPAPRNVPSIDKNAVEMLFEMERDDPHAVMELIDLYLGTAPGLLDRLTEAAAKKDFAALHQTAHELAAVPPRSARSGLSSCAS